MRRRSKTVGKVEAMNESKTLDGPRLRHAALITVIGYVMGSGVPYASFSILPKLYSADDAVRTSQNIVAHQGLAIVAFKSQFAFGLIIFGLHLILLGWLIYRSGHIPRWLGIVLVINGAGWSIMEAGPYLAPGIDLDLLLVTTAGELSLLVWLIGWGTRLTEPITNPASDYSS